MKQTLIPEQFLDALSEWVDVVSTEFQSNPHIRIDITKVYEKISDVIKSEKRNHLFEGQEE